MRYSERVNTHSPRIASEAPEAIDGDPTGLVFPLYVMIRLLSIISKILQPTDYTVAVWSWQGRRSCPAHRGSLSGHGRTG